MEVYREAVEPIKLPAGDGDRGLDVAKAGEALVAAPSNAEGSEFIAWWHHDWRTVGEILTRAAGRMRKCAATIVPVQSSKS